MASRFLPLVALLALAACGPEPSGLSPDEALDAAHAALNAGDADRALALVEEAADGGHVAALGMLAHVRERGYLVVPSGPDHPKRYVTVWSLPGQAARTRRAYEQALAAAAQAGDPEALLLLASDLAGSPTFINGDLIEPTMAPVTRDSVYALYERVAETDVPRLRVALLAKQLGDDDAYRRHVGEAVEAGEPNACTFQLWMTGTPRDLTRPEGYAAYIDALLGCPDPDALNHAQESIRPLLDNAEAGLPEAVAFLDALRADGLLDRHPALSDA